MAEAKQLRSRLETEMTTEGALRSKLGRELAIETHSRIKLERAIAEDKTLRNGLEMDIIEEKSRKSRLEQEIARNEQLRDIFQDEFASLREQLTGNIASWDKNIADINEQIIDNDTETVAFFVVSHDNFGPVTMLTSIPFPVEEINVGGGWKSNINAFQAPVAGYYLFFASAASNYSGPRTAIIHTDTRGDHIVASMVSGGFEIIGDANAGIIYLAQNDYVTVRLFPYNNGSLYSTPGVVCSTFSGFILFQ